MYLFIMFILTLYYTDCPPDFFWQVAHPAILLKTPGLPFIKFHPSQLNIK